MVTSSVRGGIFAPSSAAGQSAAAGEVPAREPSRQERPGNLSLGGVFYLDGHPPQGNRVEMRFVLPGTRHEVRARGEVLRVTREGGRFGAHVRFTDLPLPSELAIARFLQRG